ncbi:MAG: sporulation protein [Rubripirellula sp.]|nr:sporulation protein [Rubripirellula sp.]
MAKCDLSIILDDPQAAHAGGGKVSGVVRVQVDADVACKGLEVKSLWRTHGRGNVATDTAGTLTLFEGQWQAGETQEYRFELPIAHWPPSFQGYYLSVDHYVDARAKIPWAFDPKASEPFQVVASCGPEETQATEQSAQMKGIAGCFVSMFVLAALVGFGLTLTAFGVFALLLLIIPLLGGVWWFFRKFLPKYLLGDVRVDFSESYVSPGATASGQLVIRPRKNVSINEIDLHFHARERCVSGSGSNRTTHRHTFVDTHESIHAATTLTAGKEHRFPLNVSIPEDAAYSLNLSDNEVIWSTTLRVDIPRWPDWVKEIPLLVLPSGENAGSNEAKASPADVLSAVSASPQSFDATDTGGMEGANQITFKETAHHVWSVREDRSQVEELAEAISGLSFDLEAEIERRLLYAGEDDPHVFKDGYAVWAHYLDPPLPLVLYVPHELADEFEQIGRDVWRGSGTIVGWDALHGRLQIKLESPS